MSAPAGQPPNPQPPLRQAPRQQPATANAADDLATTPLPAAAARSECGPTLPLKPARHRCRDLGRPAQKPPYSSVLRSVDPRRSQTRAISLRRHGAHSGYRHQLSARVNETPASAALKRERVTSDRPNTSASSIQWSNSLSHTHSLTKGSRVGESRRPPGTRDVPVHEMNKLPTRSSHPDDIDGDDTLAAVFPG